MGYEIIENDVIRDVKQEINRQVVLKEKGRFRYTPKDTITVDGGIILNSAKLAMLIEEVGEVGRCVLSGEQLVEEKLNNEDMYDELKQVAAVSIAWMESLLVK